MADTPDDYKNKILKTLEAIAGEGRLAAAWSAIEPLTKPEPVPVEVKPNHVITANSDTLIKKKAVASNYLTAAEKVVVPKGHKLGVLICKYDSNQHLYIKLTTGNEGYIYRPHWDLGESLEAPKNGKFNDKGQLSVPYCNQNDNWDKFHGPGYRQCNLTSNTMMALALKPGFLEALYTSKGYKEPEDALGEIVAKYGDTTDHVAIGGGLAEIGIKSYFTYSASTKDLCLALDKGIPVVMGVAYKASGHMILAVGYNKDGVWIHDPFGVRIGMTDNYENASGKYDFVTYDWIQAKWLDMGNEAGWARFVTHVDDVATGVPSGL